SIRLLPYIDLVFTQGGRTTNHGSFRSYIYLYCIINDLSPTTSFPAPPASRYPAPPERSRCQDPNNQT
ncbi:uncharacterized protein PgNI_08921, partial [Pyricularia grisea]|uniref:Uncharacterized protein n=1 Tax=Pyricularia grisea TaxID=148305 RepID=A0A6P8AU62_PYRGI